MDRDLEQTGPRDDREGGFSLIELAIMLGVGIVLMTSALSGALSHGAQRRTHGERILAMAACRNVLETLRGIDHADLITYHGRGFDIPGQNGEPGGLNPVDGDPDGLAGEISVTVHLNESTWTIYRVQANVRWQGATRGGFFRMETLMGDRR